MERRKRGGRRRASRVGNCQQSLQSRTGDLSRRGDGANRSIESGAQRRSTTRRAPDDFSQSDQSPRLRLAAIRRSSDLTYLDVATAQTEALNQERNAVQLQGARLMTSVNLIKALGCGWQPSAEVLQVPAK